MTLGCRCRLLLAALLACASAVVANAAPSHAAAAPADRLVLQANEVPGLSAGRSSVGDARAVLARALGDGEAAGSTPSRVEAASYADAGAATPRLDVRAYAFRTTSVASTALAAWRRSARRAGHAPVDVAIGTRALVTARRAAGRADVVVVLRAGRVLAQVRYRAATDLKVARETALGYARLEAARLTTVANRTVADRVLDGVRPDGTLPPRTLLQLVALLYGPVDGVSLPEGRPGPPSVDATTVLEQLRANAAALTPAQREAAERAVAVAAPAGPRRARRRPCAARRPATASRPSTATRSTRRPAPSTTATET